MVARFCLVFIGVIVNPKLMVFLVQYLKVLKQSKKLKNLLENQLQQKKIKEEEYFKQVQEQQTINKQRRQL